MKGDFSRLTFDARNNYSQVLLQQGRVLLDADFNELAALSAYRLRQLARDTFGPHAGPVDASGNPGFFISVVNKLIQAGAGRYYVDGLPLENSAPRQYRAAEDLGIANGALHLLYLDVWERHVTWLDQEYLSEPALGGPDTATRAQIAWRIRAYDLQNEDDAGRIKDWTGWLNKTLRRWPRAAKTGLPWLLPQLTAWTDPQDGSDDLPCVADPAGGYRGLENQLYRVEIHTPGSLQDKTPPTFKWSRENGAVTAPWLLTEGDELVVEGIRDTARGFSAGQWVELTSRGAEDAGLPGVMVQLVKVDSLRLTIDRDTASGAIPDPKLLTHPIVRRWDQREARNERTAFSKGAIVLDETREAYTLEAGIKIAFPPYKEGKGSTQYRTGDYWLIPARPAIGNILWPRSGSAGQPKEPDGVEHVYAPLALVQLGQDGTPALSGKPLQLKYVPKVAAYT